MKTYQRLRSREVYRNPFLAIEAHEIVHPSGVTGEHALIVTPPCSAVIVADGGDLLFTRQPRFGAQAEVLEIVKGGAEPGETSLQCAQRETREELGIVAAHWKELGRLYEIPSIMDTPVDLFLAHGIEHVEAEFEPVETIELVRIPQDVAIAAAASGKINDAVTVAALLRYGIASGALVAAAAEAAL
ncbi:MAG TPA: NUDIX hydrolase [Candidatus Baltobacteraceae bacterium]|nr:NUDIX hydrolase [Candidatus Baltobacteraceae bacterium]